MTLTINADLRTTTVPRQEPGDSRRRMIEELLDTMAWDPKERVGAFRSWLRGSLSLVHLQVITTLEAEGPLSMTHLAEALDVSVASATGIVGRMEERGLVERRHRDDDRRVVEVHITPRGQKVFQVMERQRRTRFASVLEHLTEGELEAFLVGMRAMRAARAKVKAGLATSGAASADAPEADR